jgi:hypothetical protein
MPHCFSDPIIIHKPKINFSNLRDTMCVDTMGYNWERPAISADLELIAKIFPGVDYQGLFNAMSADGARPLTTDLVLYGAMANTPADELGMRYVPFTTVNNLTGEITKLPVMEQISEWFENTALGTDMWMNASAWSKKSENVHFAMNCGCGLVNSAAYKDGRWSQWKLEFNSS